MNIFEEAIQTRRKFHSRPEEGWTEFETSYLVADRLKTLGWKVAVGLDVIDAEAVLGRDPELVQKAMKRAASQGVPAEFSEHLIQDARDLKPLSDLIWIAFRFRNQMTRTIFPSKRVSPAKFPGLCMPADMTATPH